MADLHKGIRAIHNNVITINGDTQEDIIAWDKDGNTVSINWTNVNAWEDSEQSKYAQQRRSAYPEIGDQLDMLWHTMDKDNELQHKYYDFYQTIKKVKVAYPKK